MKVLHVTPAFYPARNWGGFGHSVSGLCDALSRNSDIELRVLTTDSDGPKRRERIPVKAFPTQLPAGYQVYYCRRIISQSVSPGLFMRLWSMVRWADVVHLTATYSFPTIPTLLVCKLLRKPVVWSPRGALQRWPGTTRAQAKLAWEKLCNALCDPGRVVLHTTSEEERTESAPRIPRTQARVIHNGIDLPELNGDRSQRNGSLRLLYLGRLHPIKGIENLLQALARIKSEVTLTLCGDGDRRYRRSLERLASELSLDRRVSFRGAIDEATKARQFLEADLCVAPSFKENFSLVVAESLAYGVPVIVGDGTPWKQVDQIGCGRCVPNSPDELAKAIEALSDAPLNEMGLRGRDWMQREFGWDVVAQRMTAAYRELINGTKIMSDSSAPDLSNNGSKLRTFLIRSGMTVLSFAMALALVEGLLRMLWPQQIGPVQFSFDPIRGAIPVPNQKARRVLPGVYDYTYSNNSLGLRGTREYAAEGAERNRILLLGDSFTYGIGVNDDQTFANLIEQRISDGEVINAGNGGTGTDYALRFFDGLGRGLHPDTGALCFFSNDFQDNERGTYYEVTESALRPRDLSKSVTARKAFLNVPSYNWLITHSHLANLIKQSFVRYTSRSDGITGHNRQETDGYCNDANKRLTERYVVELERAVRESKASFLIFYIPSVNEVLGYRANKTKSQDETALERISKENQINLISLTEVLAESDYSVEALYYVEGHWKPVAHQVAADFMAATLRSEIARRTKSNSSK